MKGILFSIYFIHIFKRFKPGIDLILCRASYKIFDPFAHRFLCDVYFRF